MASLPPIDASSLTASVITLTRDGGAEPDHQRYLNRRRRGRTGDYLIEGLSALTNPDGQYTLSVNIAKVHDSFGLGSGASSITWTRDTVSAVSEVLPLPGKETNRTFTVTVAATDAGPADSGVAYDAIYVFGRRPQIQTMDDCARLFADRGLYGQARSYLCVQERHHDLAGNVENTADKIEAKTTIRVGSSRPGLTRHPQSLARLRNRNATSHSRSSTLTGPRRRPHRQDRSHSRGVTPSPCRTRLIRLTLY